MSDNDEMKNTGWFQISKAQAASIKVPEGWHIPKDVPAEDKEDDDE